MRARLKFLVPRVLAILACSFPGAALASWPPSGRVVCASCTDQAPESAISDGAGGAIVFWRGFSTMGGLFAQHVLANGELDPAWPAEGVRFDMPAGVNLKFKAVADGAGGAFVAYTLQGQPGGYGGVVVQHLLATGSPDPAWLTNGRTDSTPIATTGGHWIALTPDGAGGAILVVRNASQESYAWSTWAYHVTSTGYLDPTWPVNGCRLSVHLLESVPGDVDHAAAGDGQGGAFVLFTRGYDYDGGAFPSFVYALHVQHVRANGTIDPTWPLDGLSYFRSGGGTYSSAEHPEIISDGAGGAYAAWTEGVYAKYYVEYYGHYVYYQVGQQMMLARLTPYAAYLTRDLGPGSHPSSQSLALDGQGGLLAAYRNASGLVLTRVLPSLEGHPSWPANPVLVNTQPSGTATIAADGSGGAFLAWEDTRGGPSDVYAHHVTGNGSLDASFPVNGAPVVTAPGPQRWPIAIAGGTAPALVAWQDMNVPGQFDVVIQSTATPVLDAPYASRGALKLSPPQPNPVLRESALRFTLAEAGRATLAIHDIAGRRIRMLADGRHEAGEHVSTWDLRDDAGRTVAPGLYLIRLEAAGRRQVQRIAALP